MHKLFFATACLLATARVYAASPVQCAKGLKMFVSRGTGEEMGLGVLGNITKVIRERIPGSDDEAITYPASSVDPNYMISVGNGTLLLKEALTEYAQACPESKIAVLGYSQGAQIVSNSFCGTLPFWTITDMDNINMEDIMKREPPLSKEVTKNVISVVLFGDTTRAARPSYNYGTWNNTGMGYSTATTSHHMWS
ncbi:hypothetical protein N7470_005449 [Penicillium chermesinum]|nr:hypothetical protein N7470_005449 [Penicillium chermesinum]